MRNRGREAWGREAHNERERARHGVEPEKLEINYEAAVESPPVGGPER